MSSDSGVRDELTIGPPGSQYSMSPAEGPSDPSEELTYQYGLDIQARSQWGYARRRLAILCAPGRGARLIRGRPPPPSRASTFGRAAGGAPRPAASSGTGWRP